MDLEANWSTIKKTFDATIGSSRHCAVASVAPDGSPCVTPIGFIFLRDDQTAFYFEEHARQLPTNLGQNPKVALLLVNSGALFWASFLLRGCFTSPPGMRLFGVAGGRRPATDAERQALAARIRPYRRFKGSSLIWSRLDHVRDIRIERCEPVTYPNVTEALWR